MGLPSLLDVWANDTLFGVYSLLSFPYSSRQTGLHTTMRLTLGLLLCMVAFTLAQPVLTPRNTAQANAQSQADQDLGLVGYIPKPLRDIAFIGGMGLTLWKFRDLGVEIQDNFFPGDEAFRTWRQPVKEILDEAILDADPRTKRLLQVLGTPSNLEKYANCYMDEKVELGLSQPLANHITNLTHCPCR